MTLDEASKIILEAIAKIEEENYTVYDHATRDQDSETQYHAISCLGTNLFIAKSEIAH
jgi:hypothetical protein